MSGGGGIQNSYESLLSTQQIIFSISFVFIFFTFICSLAVYVWVELWHTFRQAEADVVVSYFYFFFFFFAKAAAHQTSLYLCMFSNFVHIILMTSHSVYGIFAIIQDA